MESFPFRGSIVMEFRCSLCTRSGRKSGFALSARLAFRLRCRFYSWNCPRVSCDVGARRVGRKGQLLKARIAILLLAYPELSRRDKSSINSLARRQAIWHSRRTFPSGLKATPKISGTSEPPTSKRMPPSDTSRMKHSTHGASGAGIKKPGL